MNAIPGVDVLGFGFNILGEYDVSSITTQLFIHKNADASQYTYQPTGISYQVPDNTSVITSTHTTGTTQVFNTRQQFEKFFSAKAGVSGSYGAFSGEFNAAYSQTANTDKTYYYGLSESEYTGWELILQNQSSEWLSTAFTEDPTVQTLPSSFNQENQEQFFEVFRKFGTHFVSKAITGGSLYYYEAVEESYSSNEQQIQANLSLEFKAVFYSAGAEAEAEWKQLGETWAESRIVKVDATGGDTSVLNALNPTYGESYSSIFDSWATAVMENPAVVTFQLTPLSALFSGEQANAVSEALQEYVNGAIIANANADLTPGHGPSGGNYTTSSSIMVNGSIIKPDPYVPQPNPTIWHWTNQNVVVPISGFQIALLNIDTLEPIMSHIYYLDNTSLETEQKVYPEMMNDINEITEDNYLCIVSGFAVDLMAYPSPDFANWLATCGAGLTGWKQYIGFTGSPGMVSYVCIGQKGFIPGNATEGFSMTTDWADNPYAAGSIDASAEILLYASQSQYKLAKEAEGSK